MKRLLGGVVALIATAGMAWPAQAGEKRFVYLATAASGGSTDLFQRTQTPAGEPAPFGTISVVPVGRAITLSIDDLGAPDGSSVPVEVWAGAAKAFGGCLAVRTPRSVSGLVPNRPVTIYVGEDFHFAHCPATGTAGVATVTGIK